MAALEAECAAVGRGLVWRCCLWLFLCCQHHIVVLVRAALRNDGCIALDGEASMELGLCPDGATFTVWNCVQLI
ncbi:unnamed protein product [Anisakis simplex]|uniref:Secreted protein n=1 Tax=Anisakis simplex TaxID=6269 RepID=A0A0M3JCD0_ANISI|nr:unnamed protein product [Anisakis simplex]